MPLRFTHQTNAISVIPPARQQHIAAKLNSDTEIMGNTALQEQIAHEPQDIQAAVLAISPKARNRSLQIGLFIPALAGLLGLASSLRMSRPPDITPVGTRDGIDFG